MSLYNMIAGSSKSATISVHMLRTATDIPRFRDAWLSEDGSQIVVLTRTGGGNREEYESENEAMRTIPGFLFDEDDEFDSTFARFHYSVPAEFLEDARIVADVLNKTNQGAASRGPRAVVDSLTGALQEPTLGPDSPEIDVAVEAYNRIVTVLLSEK